VTEPSLRRVIDNDLCIGCGACAAAEPEVRLELEPRKLMYEPTAAGGELAAAVCPAVRVDYAGLQAALFPDRTPGPLGVVERISLAQSIDRERNLRASSGGMIKELLRSLLARDDVDGAIALQHVEGLAYEPALITEVEQVDRLPGSIYQSVDFSRAIELLEAHRGRFVLVAIPCQLEGIYSYARRCNPELIERIYTTIGLICGWTYSHHSLRAICEYKGLDADAVEDVSVRGGGPVGPLRLELESGSHEIDRRRDPDYVVAFDRSYNVPRCHLCINHLNVLAEIVVGDAWLARTARSSSGVSIVITRTARAAGWMSELAAAGLIRQAEAGEAEIVESQGRNFTYGDSAYALARQARASGRYCPDLVGPNRDQAQLEPARRARAFLRRNDAARALQKQRRYRYLWWRKVLRDTPRYAYRFLRKKLARRRRGRPESGESAGFR
jgi:coenzyme F420 hydrogenase subunit beta